MRFFKVLFIYLFIYCCCCLKRWVWLDWSLRWKEWYNLKTLILLANILWSFRPIIPLVIVFYLLPRLWSYDGTLTMKNCSLKCLTFLPHVFSYWPCVLLLTWKIQNEDSLLSSIDFESFWFGGFWISLFFSLYIYIYIYLFFFSFLHD
jgi:hypothetical protein